MAVTDVKASLSIYGDSKRTAAHVTAVLGVEPTQSHEFGDPSRSSKRAAAGVIESKAFWDFEEPRTMSSDEDPHGMESLVKLVARFAPLAPELAGLREAGYEMRVWMLAFSGSDKGGFYIGPQTLRGLAAIGAPLLPDIYLDAELFAADLGR